MEYAGTQCGGVPRRAIRALVCDAINLPVEGYRQLNIDYGSLTCVDYGKHQNNLIFMNYTPRDGTD